MPAGVATEDPDERPGQAWMGLAGKRDRVAADHRRRMRDHAVDVVLAHRVGDHRDRTALLGDEIEHRLGWIGTELARAPALELRMARAAGDHDAVPPRGALLVLPTGDAIVERALPPRASGGLGGAPRH